MSLKSLIELMKKELKIHEKILIAKRDERRWIATANAPALLESSQYLRKLTEEAADLERERRHIVDALTTHLGIENPEPSLRDILAVLPPANRAELEQSGGELLEIVKRVKEQNQVNAIILQRAVNTFNDEIAEMIDAKDSGVYTRAGAKANRSPLRAGLNLRA